MRCTYYCLLVMLFISGILISCEEQAVCIPGEEYPIRSKHALTNIRLVGDELNSKGYDIIEKSLRENKLININIYQYEPYLDLDEEIERNKLVSVMKTSKSHLLKKDNWQYIYDVNTGYLDAGNIHKLHAMPPAGDDEVASDEFYIQRGFYWAKQNELFVESGHVSTKPYKLRKYYIAVDKPTFDGSEEHISELALSFSDYVDGWPVMGANKNVVHLSVSGEVIGYSKIHKKLGKEVFRLTNEDLLTPQEALDSLVLDGMVENATLIRSDFGYFDFNKHNVGLLLAPYYVFVFSPNDGSKQLVRPVLAVKNPDIRKILLEDRKKDTDRKLSLMTVLEGDK